MTNGEYLSKTIVARQEMERAVDIARASRAPEDLDKLILRVREYAVLSDACISHMINQGRPTALMVIPGGLAS